MAGMDNLSPLICASHCCPLTVLFITYYNIVFLASHINCGLCSIHQSLELPLHSTLQPSIPIISHLVFRLFCLVSVFSHPGVVLFCSWCFVLHCWLTERRYVDSVAQAASPTMERTAGVDRPLVKPTSGRSVQLQFVYQERCFVCLFNDVSALLSVSESWIML